MITKKTAKRIVNLINELAAAYDYETLSAEWNDSTKKLRIVLKNSAYRPEFNSLYNFLDGFGKGLGNVDEMDSFTIS